MSFVRRMRNPVFAISVFLITVLVFGGVYYSSEIEGFFGYAQDTLTHYTGWLVILIINATLVFALYLAFGPYKHLRIGGEDAEPEFSMFAWVGMLFAAGMGIGLMFYSVAEPLAHYDNFIEYFDGRQADTAQFAMNKTFLHWGLHPWAVYALVALALAWFHYSKAQPLSFLGPLAATISPKHAVIGGMILNIFAILGTVFGISTSLGFGTAQASAGISILTGWESTLEMQIGLIVVVCVVSFLSVLSGVGRGIRVISQVNLVLAGVLLLFVLFAGETIFALKAFGQHLGYYFNNLIQNSTWREAYTGTNWQADWTILYWVWWISWSPFVGLFIARISKGRTIGSFITGVLFIPSLFNFLWMSVFGSNALHDTIFGEGKLLGVSMDESLFAMLGNLPLSEVTIALATFIVLLFFVTSADSGALVAATLASGGERPHFTQRCLWSMAVMIVTIALLYAGGLQALQTAAIISGLPFALVLVLLGWALRKNLRHTVLENG